MNAPAPAAPANCVAVASYAPPLNIASRGLSVAVWRRRDDDDDHDAVPECEHRIPWTAQP